MGVQLKMKSNKILLIIGAIALIFIVTQMGQKEMKKEAGETLARVLPSAFINPGQTFQLQYIATPDTGLFYFTLLDDVTGGCTKNDGTTTHIVGTMDSSPKIINMIAPSSAGSCHFVGNWQLGSGTIVDFVNQDVVVTGSGCTSASQCGTTTTCITYTCSGGVCSNVKHSGLSCTTAGGQAGTCSSDGICVSSTPDCTIGSAITSACKCGGTTYTSGYCCSGGWQSTTCGGPAVCPTGLISSLCTCGGVTYPDYLTVMHYCCNNIHQYTQCITPCPTGQITTACTCGGVSYSSGAGFCCANVFSGTTCVQTVCPTGAISSSCTCGGTLYNSGAGYCCTGVFQSSSCTPVVDTCEKTKGCQIWEKCKTDQSGCEMASWAWLVIIAFGGMMVMNMMKK